MMKSSSNAKSHERRSAYRVDDRIGLNVNWVPAQAEKAALASVASVRERFSMVNKLIVTHENSLPQFRQIERRSPDIASYLRSIETQIETVARVLGQSGSSMPVEPTHDVSLSATGLAFESDSAFPVDGLLELKLVLFPERVQLFLYARVVRVECELDPEVPIVSVVFEDMPEEDEELLRKHIHKAQMRALHGD